MGPSNNSPICSQALKISNIISAIALLPQVHGFQVRLALSLILTCPFHWLITWFLYFCQQDGSQSPRIPQFTTILWAIWGMGNDTVFSQSKMDLGEIRVVVDVMESRRPSVIIAHDLPTMSQYVILCFPRDLYFSSCKYWDTYTRISAHPNSHRWGLEERDPSGMYCIGFPSNVHLA